MKTNRIFIFLFLTIFSLSGYSQFSLSTELLYLQHINQQNNKRLIRGNIDDAEWTADSILSNHSDKLYNAAFFFELGKSYFLLKQYDKALFSFFRQHYLFPNDSIDAVAKIYFAETAYRCRFSQKEISTRWNITTKNLPFEKRLSVFLEQSIAIYSPNLYPFISKIGNFFKSTQTPIPIFYNQWEELVRLRIHKHAFKKIYPHLLRNSVAIYRQQQLPERLQKKIYRKYIRHYLHARAYGEAKNLLKEYRSNMKLSVFQKTDAFIKQIRIAVHL